MNRGIFEALDEDLKAKGGSIEDIHDIMEEDREHHGMIRGAFENRCIPSIAGYIWGLFRGYARGLKVAREGRRE